MRIDPPAEPLTDSGRLRAALDDVDIPPLLATVAHITGDRSVLRPEFRPDPARLIEPESGIDPARFPEARDIAAEALGRWVDDGCPEPPPLTAADRAEILAYLVGDEAAPQYHDVLTEELSLDGTDPRAPGWHKDDVAPDRPFRVAIVGAGMSGLAAAHRLQQAGVAFTIFEKNPDVGGTWYENTYPGSRVDVPNHLYSYSFAQTPDWPQYFSTQEALLEYFRSCADRFALRDHIEFDTELVQAEFDNADSTWRVHTRNRVSGLETTTDFEAVISAVGQLNRPNLPDIPGLDSFAGPWFHSARWNHDIDLAGKRVAVIGTGASAVQFVPEVAKQAGELLVFQRTPPWFAPTENYHDDIADGLAWLLRHIPTFARWDRLWIFWRMHEGLLPAAHVDPEWPDQTHSVSLLNEFARLLLTDYITAAFPDDPDLAEACIPSYPPIAKRVVRDNGSWPRALLRDRTELVTTDIAEITPTGIRTVDGTQHDVDVIIYGTGFQASKFLTPMVVTGRGGVDLHERWKGDARAYLGVSIPDFPNLFLLYGPNTNIVINGSIIFFSECGVHYIVEAIRTLLEGDHAALDCRTEVHDAFNESVDEANRQMVWGAAEVNSWYRNEHGRVAQNWPYSLLEYWQRTRTVEPSDYVLS